MADTWDDDDNWYWYEKNNGKIVEPLRSDSIGSNAALKDLQEVSSVELLRNSILQSISKKQEQVKQPDQKERYKSRSAVRKDFSDLSSSNIEVQFLQRCSSLNPHLFPVEENSFKLGKQQTPLPFFVESNQRNISNPEIDFAFADLSESNEEESSNLEESFEEILTNNDKVNEKPEPKVSSKNGLKLAFRTLNNTIFEDCSTYNINCEDAFLSSKDNVSSNAVNASTENCNSSMLSLSDENVQGNQLQKPGSGSIQCDSTDDQTSLCDTFFSAVIDGTSVSTLDNSSSKLSQTVTNVNRKVSSSKVEEIKDKHGDGENENVRIRRRIRKRNRKSKSEEPHVYECPKCGVSYIISTQMANDAAYCLHCDLWTSVDPVFLKREKQAWNTCRIF